MTRPRNDQHSTEFGLWLRKQREIDSSLGFVATNIDYKWENYKTGQWMFIEEKRYGRLVESSQRKQFVSLDKAQRDPLYRGFWIIRFQKTSPEDGLIWLGRLCQQSQAEKYEEITKQQLLGFLKGFALL